MEERVAMMRPGFFRLCLGAAFALLLGLSAPALAQAGRSCAPPANRAPFRVFDGLIFYGKPDLSRYGIEPIHIADRGFWPNNDADRNVPVDPARVRRYLENLPDDGAPVVIDIEDWDPGVADPRASADAIARLTAIHRVFADAGSNRAFGYYSMIPGRDYWRAIRGPGSPEYRAWQRENDRLGPLERRMDIIFPSIYAFYDDQEGWLTYATAQICEARRLSSKPVYVFLWFEYHPGSRPPGQFIPGDFWRLQLETARRLADGVILWGGYDQIALDRRTWDPQAPWWQETVRFLERHRR